MHDSVGRAPIDRASLGADDGHSQCSWLKSLTQLLLHISKVDECMDDHISQRRFFDAGAYFASKHQFRSDRRLY